MANWKGTPVPNTGYVEKIYFNTNLSVEEVLGMFDLETGLTIHLLNYSNGDLTFLRLTNTIDGETFHGYYLGNFTNEEVYFSSSDRFAYADYIGWNPNFDGVIEVNAEVSGTIDLSEYSSLFSITPFTQSEDKNILMHPKNEDGTANKDVNLYPRTKVGNLLASNGSKFTMPNVVYKQGGGTAVPNSGICPDIYLNTNLSIDEVKALLDTITYHDMGGSLAYFAFLSKYIIGNTNYMVQLTIVKLNNDYGVALIINDGEEDSTEILFSTSVDMGGLEGWNTTFGNIINIEQFNSTLNNIYEEIGLSVGDQNDKLSSLFSITPFTSGGLFETNEDGTPNTDKPIQTGISEERVNELIDLKITGWLGGES